MNKEDILKIYLNKLFNYNKRTRVISDIITLNIICRKYKHAYYNKCESPVNDRTFDTEYKKLEILFNKFKKYNYRLVQCLKNKYKLNELPYFINDSLLDIDLLGTGVGYPVAEYWDDVDTERYYDEWLETYEMLVEAYQKELNY